MRFAPGPRGKPVGMDRSTQQRRVDRLLATAGTTFADEGGIRLKDQPMPLFELLALGMLAGKPIDAAIATRAARELFRAGLRTPQRVLDADRRQLIDAFGRARYVRYDESSATRLTDIASTVRDRYRGEGTAQAVQRDRRHRGRHLPARGAGRVDLGAALFRRACPGRRR